MRFLLFILIVLALLSALVFAPQIDLAISGFFHTPRGFLGTLWPMGDWLTDGVFYGARVLGILLALGAIISFIRKRALLGMKTRAWLFLLAGLIIAPGLIANNLFKDQWDRARPSQVQEFGGHAKFSPAWIPAMSCHKNCSFVAGDAALGFYLHAFGYVAARRRARRIFWAGLGAGALFGLNRIAMGAHFFSDVIFAGVFMLGAMALLHMLFFGFRATREAWKVWLPGLFGR